jgi:hypothetical protein
MKRLFIYALLILSAQVVSAQIVKNNFRVTQYASYAIIGGKDGDKQNESDYDNTPANGTNLGDVANSIDDEIVTNLGSNVEYALTFIPGRKSNDGGFVDNLLGFAMSPGLILSFDKQGGLYTFNGMLKFGVEVGHDHPIGMGVDILFGGGKSSCFAYFLEENGNDNEPLAYTEWCFKNGFQFWVRTGLLKQFFPNSTTSIFLRYVYSMEPYAMEADENVFFFWQEEAWQMGFRLTFPL